MATTRRRTTQLTKPARRPRGRPPKSTSGAAVAKALAAPSAAETSGTSTTRASGLAAALLVLRDAGEPLRAQAIVDRMLAQGLWTTQGKTPAATISAAIGREIRAKGAASRFRLAERGHFAPAG